jgi:hypothetical protein
MCPIQFQSHPVFLDLPKEIFYRKFKSSGIKAPLVLDNSGKENYHTNVYLHGLLI